MSRIRILIVDDHRVVIEGIKSALRDHPEIEVVGDALDGREAVKKVESVRPDIVIMDIAMPKLNGIDATIQIKAIDPGIRIIIFTMYSDREYIIDLFKAGVSGYVLKEDPMSYLILAIKAVQSGGAYFSTMASSILLDHIKELEENVVGESGVKRLSLREREVFQLLAEGRSIKEIANQLYISPRTVESHKYSIMQKLGAASIIDLTKIAIKKKLIKI
jgi:DNA-binding NarL/FixJ family response regulator